MNEWKIIKEIVWQDEDGEIHPLAAGSGLVKSSSGLWAVGDDLHHLILISEDSSPSRGFMLFDEKLPDDPKKRKKVKKDSEALFELSVGRRPALVAFPSGSKKNRHWGNLIHPHGAGLAPEIRAVDFKSLLHVLDEVVDDLNIEGGFVRGDDLILMQRGNGKARVNALVSVSLERFLLLFTGQEASFAKKDFRIQPIELPEWDGFPLTFTDGFLFQEQIYFSAAAEGTEDTYNDGEVIGSVVGRLNGDGTYEILHRLEKLKLEGLAFEAEESRKLLLLGITDADDPEKPSLLIRFTCAI